MVADDISARQLEAQEVIDYELVERLQQERGTSQWFPVEPLALLMTYCFFDDLNTELRPG